MVTPILFDLDEVENQVLRLQASQMLAF